MSHTRIALAGAAALALTAVSNARSITLYANTLCQGPSAAWEPQMGQWEWTPTGLSPVGAGPESRIFLGNMLQGNTEYRVTFDAMLETGDGWRLFFNADAVADLVAGYSFDALPNDGAGSVALTQWDGDILTELESVSSSLSEGAWHSFELVVEVDRFRAFRDGLAALDYEGVLSPGAQLTGFGTMSGSDATFRNFKITTIPSPGSAIALAGLPAALGARRRRSNGDGRTRTADLGVMNASL